MTKPMYGRAWPILGFCAAALLLRSQVTSIPSAGSPPGAPGTTPTNSTYADWRVQSFTPDELTDPAVSGDSADPDHDGLTNLQEFIAGTDPKDATSVLKVDSIQWVGVPGVPSRIRFTAMANRSYTVQCQDSSGAPWLVLANVTAQPTNSVAEVKDFGANRYGLRLYRIVTPQQP